METPMQLMVEYLKENQDGMLDPKEFLFYGYELLPKERDLINQHTTTQIEALRERLKEGIHPENLVALRTDQVINQFLKELSDGK
jgi:hypothetical protein